MKPSVKKAFNIFSYALNIAFVAFFVWSYFNRTGSASEEDKFQYIKECIIERESADLPLKIQKLDKVHGITIDSMVITSNVEPYTGYLITTWDIDEKQNLSLSQLAANGYKDKYVRKQKEVYVEITDIKPSMGGKVSWRDNWGAAYNSVKDID